MLQAGVERQDSLAKAKEYTPCEQEARESEARERKCWHGPSAGATSARSRFQAGGAQQARFVLRDAFAAKTTATRGTEAHGLPAFVVPTALVERGAIHGEG